MPFRVLWTAVCGLALAACSGGAPPNSAAETNRPFIERIRPTTGPAGAAYPIKLIIEGRYFADSANVVGFGPVEVPGVPAVDGGTRLELYVPKEQPSTGEAPPMVLDPGVYEVSVTTRAGKSNTRSFILTREPS